MVYDHPMGHVDVRVRAPAGGAWLTFIGGLLGASELAYELNKPGKPELLGIPFTFAELLVPTLVLSAVSLVGAAWLLMLHTRPGRIGVTGSPALLRRERRRRWRREVIEAPLAQWKVSGQFFSKADERAGRFKRLQLEGPGLREVLLYADVVDGETLWATLRELREALGGWQVSLQAGGDSDESAARTAPGQNS